MKLRTKSTDTGAGFYTRPTPGTTKVVVEIATKVEANDAPKPPTTTRDFDKV